MNHWLLKSEPDTFSIDDLARSPEHTTRWDGVRNYQVRNMLRDDMRVGDLGLFYHSSCAEPGAVGVVRIVRSGYPDPAAWNPDSPYFDPKSDPAQPRWYCVDVKLKQRFATIVSLDRMRRCAELADLLILRKGNRLSITPLTTAQFATICQMGQTRASDAAQ